MIKGIVVEKNKNNIIVMTSDGIFEKVKVTGNKYNLGQEELYPSFLQQCS